MRVVVRRVFTAKSANERQGRRSWPQPESRSLFITATGTAADALRCFQVVGGICENHTLCGRRNWLEQNYDYDAAGNASLESSREYVSSSSSNKYWSTRSYYGADEKLRVFNRFAGLGPNSDGSDRAHLGVYEEYWYDALGRRIQVRSRRDAGCNTFWPECPSAVNRVVWDGDQVLMERRVTGSDADASWLDGGGTSVGYAHMGGIDAPVAAFKDGVMVVPHANWRGEFEDGHAVIGTLPVINWPAKYEALDGAPSNPPTYVWFGDMLTGYTDGSGQKYRRNRYYDPVKGTFTQQDPIGLAGGLNLYGYADGDPVNFSDPFGLCPRCLVFILGKLNPFLSRAGAALSGLTGSPASSPHTTYEIAPNVLSGVVASAKASGQGPGRQIFEAARQIGNMKLGQQAATDAVEQAVTKLGYDRGPTVTIDGVNHVLAGRASGPTVTSVAIDAAGAASKAAVALGKDGWRVVEDLGPIRTP